MILHRRRHRKRMDELHPQWLALQARILAPAIPTSTALDVLQPRNHVSQFVHGLLDRLARHVYSEEEL